MLCIPAIIRLQGIQLEAEVKDFIVRYPGEPLPGRAGKSDLAGPIAVYSRSRLAQTALLGTCAGHTKLPSIESGSLI